MHGGSLCPKDQPRAAYREREMRGRLAIDLVRFWRRYPTAEHMVGRHLRRLGCEVLEDLEHVAVGLPMDQELMMRHRLASVRHTVRMNCVLQWVRGRRAVHVRARSRALLISAPASGTRCARLGPPPTMLKCCWCVTFAAARECVRIHCRDW